MFFFRRQRDFHCCGWNSYLDYAASHKTDLPDTCCHKVCFCRDFFLINIFVRSLVSNQFWLWEKYVN